MAGSSTQYETLYGVGLLDDLHNYFPAILYDSGQFHSTQELLQYIQRCVRNRFDLFSFGQRSYLNTTLPPPQQPLQQQQRVATPERDLSGNQVPPPAPRRAAASPLNTYRSFDILLNSTNQRNPVRTLFQFEDDLDAPASSLLNLVSLLGGLRADAPLYSGAPGAPIYRPNDFTDVVVAATEDEVNAATARIFPENETPCSICQDSIATNQMARQITFCRHMFHISCIDEWFARDVHCPVCRHDIRDTNAQTIHAETRHP